MAKARKQRTKDTMQQITANFAADVRYDTMEGREFVVAPMIMLTEGVHNGSNGPVYYSPEELAKIPVIWNSKPVVVYHPQINGKGVSACDPDIFTNHKVGVIMNTHYDDGKLKAEAWLEVERVKAVDERVLDALESGDMMELSTGLFTDNEYVEGEWNGEAYSAVVRNFRPDHLALLPDQKGACSISDGAGFLRLNQKGSDMDKILAAIITQLQTYTADQETDREEVIVNQYTKRVIDIISNQMSHDNIRMCLVKLLQEDNPGEEYAWIADVYEDYLVYELQGKLWKIGYTKDNDKVELTGDPIEVVRITEYRTADTGTYVGNETDELTENERNIQMDRTTKVNELIANGAWTEDDREFLTNMEEDKFGKLATPVANTEDVVEDVVEDTQPEATEPTDNMTAEQYIAQAPPQIAEVLANGVKAHNKEKAELVASITANKQNVFTAEQLNAKPLNELQGIAKLAVNTGTTDFSGQGDPVQAPTDNVEAPLDTPEW